MKRKLVYALACLLLSLHAMAQHKITGRVTDAKDNTALPSVSVVVKGTRTGAMSDANGNFSLTIPGNSATLQVSYVGYEQQDVQVNEQTTTLNIALVAKLNQINDVVVIGYGTVKKSDLTGSVATVKAEQLMDKPVPNVSQALQGKVAGVDVSVNSNAPGAAAKVRVRGLGSINLAIDPLYVVDGVIGVDINNIDPNDVASLEVLKDASSTAIYGARGANGVIIITTKRGRSGNATVSYDGNVNLAENYRHLPTLNSDEFVKVFNQAFANDTKFDPNGGTWLPNKALNHINYPKLFDQNDKPLYNTNWEKETYKPAFSTQHQLSVQGGSEKSVYSLSLGYLDQNGIMVNSWFKRYSARFTMDNDIKKWLKVGGSLSVINSRQNFVSGDNGSLNVPRMVTEEVPLVPIKYPDGTWAGNNDIDGLEGGPNPVHIAQSRYTINNKVLGLGDAYLLFHIIPGLDLKSDFGFSLTSEKNNFYSGQDLPHLSQDQGGQASITTNTYKYWQSENYFTYNHKFDGNHSMTALLGISFQQYANEYAYAEGQNFVTDFLAWHALSAAAVRSKIDGNDGMWRMQSEFARATYNIKDRYLFTGTARYDGSSKFGTNNKYGFFPSIGAAWRISQEEFMKNAKNISNLKLRASYGAAGNSELPSYKSEGQTSASTVVLGGASQPTLLPNYIGNPNLKWERSVQFDAGVELGLFQDRINLNVDYYHRKTKDLLLQAPIPWSAGMREADVYENVGSVLNTGIEVALNTVNVKTKNVTWSTTFLFAHNKNEILSLNDGNADIFPGPNFLGQTNVLRVGHPIGSFYGMTRLGIYSESEADLAAAQGLHPGDRKYLLNKDGSINYSIIGQSTPKWTGNITSTLNFKNWDFSFDIRFVQGINTAATFKHSSEDRQTLANSLKTVLNAWTPDHQTGMVAQVRSYKFTQDSHFDTWWVEDGSFIRGQNFTLGYSLPSTTLTRSHINKFRIYASVQNLFIITKYTGYDPEVDTYNTTVGQNNAFSQNLDFFSYPRPRVWNLGVQVGF